MVVELRYLCFVYSWVLVTCLGCDLWDCVRAGFGSVLFLGGFGVFGYPCVCCGFRCFLCFCIVCVFSVVLDVLGLRYLRLFGFEYFLCGVLRC